jgi:hypothetical protein
VSDKPFTATRWIVVQGGTASEVAITTPNGKRLKESTRADIMRTLDRPEKCAVYPISYSVRITPLPTPTGGPHEKP